MSLVDPRQAAVSGVTVYFWLRPEAKTHQTLEGEVGHVYRAVLCINDPTDVVGYYELPYAYSGDGWVLVGRPWFDFWKVSMYTELKEALDELRAG